MAGNTLPIVPKAGRIGVATLSSATVGRTVTGVTGLTLLLTADATNGSRLDAIKYTSNGAIGTANSANVLRIWTYTGAGNAVLHDEIAIAGATTPSATAAGATGLLTYVSPFNQFVIPAGSSVYVSIHTYAGAQDGYNVIAYGGDY